VQVEDVEVYAERGGDVPFGVRQRSVELRRKKEKLMDKAWSGERLEANCFAEWHKLSSCETPNERRIVCDFGLGKVNPLINQS
jgi:hypothetical protein